MKVICLLFFMWLSLGCSITKTLPQNSQTQNSQQDFHIDASQAFALITPSTTLELAEDKQALALTFEQVFHQQRPQLKLKSLANTLSDINTANLTETYRLMLVNHHQSGVFEQDALQKVGQATHSRYLVLLKLAQFQQGSDSRWSLLGIRVFQTKFGRIRLFMQIWDAEKGRIVWEGMQEMNLAYDTIFESSVTFNQTVTESTTELIKQLP